MRILKGGLKRNIGLTDPVKYEVLLILGILGLFVTSCAMLRRGDGIEVTEPKIVVEGNVTYWCLEEKDFTAVLQEADRCR